MAFNPSTADPQTKVYKSQCSSVTRKYVTEKTTLHNSGYMPKHLAHAHDIFCKFLAKFMFHNKITSITKTIKNCCVLSEANSDYIEDGLEVYLHLTFTPCDISDGGLKDKVGSFHIKSVQIRDIPIQSLRFK
jgi:hypothetical protein